MKEVKSLCNGLLQQCQNNTIYNSQSRLKQNYAMSQLRKKISPEKMMNKISPQEEQQNNRIIEKMRKKYHKKQKQSSIKKTDLGQDLLTFTKEQFQKLQFIDECQQKNIVYRQNLESYDDENNECISAVDKLKKMAKIDDIIDEVKINFDWGDIKENAVKKYYLRGGDKKGFVKRVNLASTNVQWKVNRQHTQQKILNDKRSLQKYYHTLLNKNSFNKEFLNSEPRLVKKNPNTLSFSQKIQIIKDEASRNLERYTSNKTLFMTEQRKNALYECQILRLSKKVLGTRQYENIHFVMAEKQGQCQKQDIQGDSTLQNESNSCEAEEILQKNYRRINEQRKRVIEKLVC